MTATTAQLVQALVILIAVSFGYFTSMNQALVGAMAGAGSARGRHAVKTTEPARHRARLGDRPADGVPPGAPCGTCRPRGGGADSLAR